MQTTFCFLSRRCGAQLLGLCLLANAGLQPVIAKPEAIRPEQPRRAETAPIDDKTKLQIMEAEKQLAATVLKHDASALDRLLGEQYMSAEDGAEWAVSKRGALIRCGAGKLPAYQIEREPKFRRDRQAIVLEGLARPAIGAEAEDEKAQWVHVTHYWLKLEGRWVLAAQTLPRHEAEPSEKD